MADGEDFCHCFERPGPVLICRGPRGVERVANGLAAHWAQDPKSRAGAVRRLLRLWPRAATGRPKTTAARGLWEIEQSPPPGFLARTQGLAAPSSTSLARRAGSRHRPAFPASALAVDRHATAA